MPSDSRPAAAPATDHTPAPLAVAAAACAAAGLDARDAQLVHHYASAVVHLPRAGAVARIGPGDRTAAADRCLALVRWLIDEGFPVPAPLGGLRAVHVASSTVTFWHHHPQHGAATSRLDSAALGALLRRLHDLPDPPVDLPSWRPLTGLEQALTEPWSHEALPDDDRDWVLRRIAAVRAGLDHAHLPLGRGLIHGDAWAGNLLHGARGRVLLGDWDDVAWGPREVDLVPTWHAARRYRDEPDWTTRFAAAYGHDLAASTPDFELLMQMRDLVQISGPLRHAAHSPVHARALRQRLDGTRARDSRRWHQF
ncbi:MULTISPECIES: aminoglycoside phosphotransferase family protein [Actinosynnema]|uniref:aminoglycoside phosphotransferase family protein n=1 Tax=Actinosynnema TaxID=40566 RepID=UPI0020A27F27|nr:aminoglycoside phosphotransferase family protein [Actinosynnema pretiosum]MCP2097424.1 Phosphotransferase enzyme family protein [Actinosynnema pretiosum]